jgi:hypothetical protein
MTTGVNEATAVLHCDNYHPDPPKLWIYGSRRQLARPDGTGIADQWHKNRTKENRSGSARIQDGGSAPERRHGIFASSRAVRGTHSDYIPSTDGCRAAGDDRVSGLSMNVQSKFERRDQPHLDRRALGSAGSLLG